MRDYKKERLGMKFTHQKYGEYEVVEYKNSMEVTIKFKNTGSTITSDFHNIEAVRIRDREAASVLGVGILGNCLGKINGKHLKSYVTWKSMLARCYCQKTLIRQPTYVGCSVCAEWFYFPTFKLWFDENYIEGCHLDKDIKVKGNKIYSPDTCLFVTPSENTKEAGKKAMYYTLIKKPCGDEVLVHNQKKFCRENNIPDSPFYNMINGGQKQTNGYTLIKKLTPEEAKEYTNKNKTKNH